MLVEALQAILNFPSPPHSNFPLQFLLCSGGCFGGKCWRSATAQRSGWNSGLGVMRSSIGEKGGNSRGITTWEDGEMGVVVALVVPGAG